MKLLIDVGNTRLKWALWNGVRLGSVATLTHKNAGSLDFATLWKEVDAVESIWIASVAAPTLNATLSSALHARFGSKPRFARSAAQACGVRNAYPQPERLGVDRFLSLIAVHMQAPEPTVIAGCGTALTLDALAADGTHLGGLIAPGPQLMQFALHAGTAQLRAPTNPRIVEFADTTDDAIESGTWLAGVALVERFAARAAEHFHATPSLALAGGGAARLGQWLALPHRIDSALVLRGLAQLADAGE